MIDIAVKGEFLQKRRPLNTANLLFKATLKPRYTPWNQATPRPALYRREPVADNDVLIVDQQSAYSKFKPRLTRYPTQRSALRSGSPASHEPGRHVRGELCQQPPSAVGGRCCRARPAARAATFARPHNSWSKVSCSCLVDVYHCLLSILSTTTNKAASIVPAMPAEACRSATGPYERTHPGQ